MKMLYLSKIFAEQMIKSDPISDLNKKRNVKTIFKTEN
jgi:hypothetical protein